MLTLIEWLVALGLVIALPIYTYRQGWKRGWREGLLEGGRALQNEGRQREHNDGK